ncbi:MAG: ATPase, partial [Gemmatimonadetes bacterium]|nr:ATPase [Gemmatimonadota bacterium]
ETLLQSKPPMRGFSLPTGEAIKNDEWERWREEMNEVRISKETLNVIHDIRLSFQKKGEDLDIYVSDRRWQQSAIFLKAAAFFCGRQETNLVDALLLRHCLWTSKENHGEVVSIVENAVRNSGFETGIGIPGVDREKEELEKEIRKELYLSEDIYETVDFGGDKYFGYVTAYTEGYGRVEKITIFFPLKKIKTKDEFNPVDAEGNKLDWIRCRFDGQGSCEIRTHEYGAKASSFGQGDQYWKDATPFTPKVLLRKGDRKEDVNPRLVQSLCEAVGGLRNIFESAMNGVESKLNQFRKELESPFVPAHTRNIALESVEQQLLDMKLRLKDCDRLENLIAGNSSSPAISPKAVPTRKTRKRKAKSA